MDNAFHDSAERAAVPALSPQKNWVGTLCTYFRDFLDTDFRRARAPKRSIIARDPSNNLTGVALSKYPDLGRDLWALLARPCLFAICKTFVKHVITKFQLTAIINTCSKFFTTAVATSRAIQFLTLA